MVAQPDRFGLCRHSSWHQSFQVCTLCAPRAQALPAGVNALTSMAMAQLFPGRLFPEKGLASQASPHPPQGRHHPWVGVEQHTGPHMPHRHRGGPKPRAGERWGQSRTPNHSSLGLFGGGVIKDARCGLRRLRMLGLRENGRQTSQRGKAAVLEGVTTAVLRMGRGRGCWTRTRCPRAAVRVSTRRAATSSIRGLPCPGGWRVPARRRRRALPGPGVRLGQPSGDPGVPALPGRSGGSGRGLRQGRAQDKAAIYSPPSGRGGPCPGTGMPVVPGPPPGRHHERPPAAGNRLPPKQLTPQ